MKIRIALGIGLAVIGIAAITPFSLAGDEEGGTAETKRMSALVGGILKFVGDKRLTEADAKSLILHGPSFNAVDKDEKGDDRFEKLLEAHYLAHGVYNFELMMADKALVAWAAKTGVDARAWTKTVMRAHTLFMRDELQESAKEMRDSMKDSLAQLEAARPHMGEEAYQMAKAAMAGAMAMSKTMDAAAKAIPAPTEDEKKILAKYGKQLRKALDHDDDDDDDSEDDEDSEDDDSEDDDEDSEDDD